MSIRELAAAAVKAEQAQKELERKEARLTNSLIAVRLVEEHLKIMVGTNHVTSANDWCYKDQEGLLGNNVVVRIEDVHVKIKRSIQKHESPVTFILSDAKGDKIEHPTALRVRTFGDTSPLQFNSNGFHTLAGMASDLDRLDRFRAGRTDMELREFSYGEPVAFIDQEGFK